MWKPVRPTSKVVSLACIANLCSAFSKKSIRSSFDLNCLTVGRRTVVTNATPPIHKTTPIM